jgi:hypothetical protein
MTLPYLKTKLFFKLFNLEKITGSQHFFKKDIKLQSKNFSSIQPAEPRNIALRNFIL